MPMLVRMTTNIFKLSAHARRERGGRGWLAHGHGHVWLRFHTLATASAAAASENAGK